MSKSQAWGVNKLDKQDYGGVHSLIMDAHSGNVRGANAPVLAPRVCMLTRSLPCAHNSLAEKVSSAKASLPRKLKLSALDDTFHSFGKFFLRLVRGSCFAKTS